MSVKYTFKNIGPIKGAKRAELSLGDLTVIAGENNAGKTYMTYALYGLLGYVESFFSGTLGVRKYRDRQGAVGGTVRHRHIHEISHEIVSIERESGGVACRLKFQDLMKEVNKHLKNLSDSFSKHELADFFSAEKSLFENAEISCQITKTEYNSHEIIGMFSHMKKIVGNPSYDKKTDTLMLTLDITPSPIGFIREIDSDGISHVRENKRITSRRVLRLLMATVVECFFSNSPFILTSERLGISLFYKELDFAKNKIVEGVKKLINADIEVGDIVHAVQKYSADYAKPITDNIDHTRGLSSVKKKTSTLTESKLFDNIKEIMQGHYRYEKDEIKFVSKAKKENKFNIPLHLASSSARGLSDLYFYLRHTAEKGQLLIMDEPESHLSPENQIEMARLLVRCVNAGIKVLITTHSDYIIKEINNLIMLSSDFEGKSRFLRKYKCYGKKDYLMQNQIKGYLCKDSKLELCDVNRYGIQLKNFDDAIKGMNKVSNTLGLLIGSEK